MKKIFITTENNIEDVRDEIYSYQYEFDHALVKNPDGQKIKVNSFEYLIDLLTFYVNQVVYLYIKEY